VKQEDPGRPTTGALSIDGIEKLHRLGELNDLLALNVYPGWYIQMPSDMGPIADEWNEAYGSRGIIISEYGAGASIRQHQQDFGRRSGRALNAWHPEEWQSIVHEGNYEQIRQRPYVLGSFIWNMFDFASANRKEGDQFGINDKGLVTRDRKVRKDAYFFYKANWAVEPMTYITSRRDVARTAAETPVTVYSNCDKVLLIVNGRAYGNSPPNDLHVFRWEHIPLAEGENYVEATGACQGRTVHDEVTWTYRPQQP
jgi:beta-galactosidase